MKEMGGVVSFILKDEDAISFCKKLRLIQFSVSIGSTESIIAPTEIFFGSDLSQSKKEQMGISHKSLRLSVGLEDIQDIIEDLETALY